MGSATKKSIGSLARVLRKRVLLAFSIAINLMLMGWGSFLNCCWRERAAHDQKFDDSLGPVFFGIASTAVHDAPLGLQLWRLFAMKSLARPLLLFTIASVPFQCLAQTCATQPSSSPPPPSYQCSSGLCAPWGGLENCPNPGSGNTVSHYIACSVAQYNAEVPFLPASSFPPLIWVGIVDNNHDGRDLSLFWHDQIGVVGGSGLTLLPVYQICPLYWVDATPPLESCSADCVGDPINPAIGNVYKTEEDIQVAGSGTVGFRRFYNSADATGTDGVPGWRHSYARSIGVIYETPSSLYPGSSSAVSPQYTTPSVACVTGFAAIQSSVNAWVGASASYNGGVCVLTKSGVTIATLPIQSYPIAQAPTTPIEIDVTRDDGRVLRYTMQNGVINNSPAISLRLATTGSGFTITDDQDTVETYNAAGVLQTITNRAGVVQTLAYSGGLWSGVTDSFGNSLSVTRNASGSIATVIVGGAGSVQYSYDGASRLSTVTNFDATTKKYTYADARFVNALTSIVDESGATLSTWAYDMLERATSTQEAGGADAQTLVYNPNGSVTITDSLGAVRSFTYSRVGDIKKVTSISGSQCPTCQESAATTYDAYGWVASRTDYNGNATCYANDPTRGLELVRVEGFAPGSTCPVGLSSYTPAAGTLQRKITTQWSTLWRQPMLITEPNRTTAFTYDGSGHMLTRNVTDLTVLPTVGRAWTYTYDSVGHVLTAVGPRSNGFIDKTIYTYNNCTTGSGCGQLATITDQVGYVTTFNTYNAYGNPLTITDPNNVLTTLTYDLRQHLKSSQVGTETTQYGYDVRGLLQTVTLPDSSTIQYGYDGAHRLNKITDAAGNYNVYTLDALGNHTAENAYDVSGTVHRTHTRVFNVLSQLYQDINAANSASVTTTYGYDNNGNRTTINAPMLRNSINQYDALNRLKQITDPKSGITQLNYDANDNLASIVDSRTFTTSYGHNGFNDVTKVVSPDTGTTTYAYDSGGNPKTATDARGAVTNFNFDNGNRLIHVNYTDEVIFYTYDAGTYGKDRLTGASDANHQMSWTYDTHGRVIGKGQTVTSITKSVGYGYTNGNLTSIVTPSGQTITYGYTNHRITSITVGSTALLTSVTYDPFGPATGWTWGNSTASSRAFDLDGAPSRVVTAGVTNIYSVDYVDRITGITDSGLSTDSFTFGYDALDRVTSGVSTGKTRGYTYDVNSNRLTASGTTQATVNISPTNNQIATTTGGIARTYGYDLAGNTTSYTGEIFTFNQRGRMSSAVASGGTTNYVYNALGQLIEKSGNGGTTLLVYDEVGHILGEYSSTGALIQETVWMGDTPVATLRPSGSTVAIYYVHTDHLGTPRKVTRPSDNGLMWRWDPDTFGSVAANVNPSGLGTFTYNLRFPGQYYLSESTLNYHYYRTYDPQMGRYLEADPIGLRGGINPYAYVVGNPISRVDPLGLIVHFDNRNPFYDAQTAILQAAYAQIGAMSFYGNMLENAMENSPFLYPISPGPDPMYASNPVHTNPFTKGIYVNTNAHSSVQVKGSCGDGYVDASPLLELEHELGHAATGALDDGPGDMNNVSQNVNPFRADAGLPAQTAYGAGPLAQPIIIPLPYSGGSLQLSR